LAVSKEDLLKKILFVPAETKEALHRWIKVYLQIDLPNCTVSEESNSNPMDLIWELYSRARDNDVEGFSRVMAYATRGGGKTLGSSILEILMMFHLKRNVGHMAATKDQSDRSQEYVINFMKLPFLRDFKTLENKKRIEITRYEHKKTKHNIVASEFALLSESEKQNYDLITNFLQIVICSLQGANGLHSEFFACDEIDTIDGERVRGYKESKNIPKARNGMLPITLLTSTRKFSYGLVQKELDAAHKTKLAVRHWNIVDVLEKCPADRHKPEEPKIDLWINDQTLEVFDDKQLENLDEVSRKNFVKQEAFAGCKTCPLFSICKTRLATHQKSDSPMLSPIAEIAAKIVDQSLEDVLTQLMCRSPSSAGLVYPKLNRQKHVKTADEIFQICNGEPPPSPMTRDSIIEWFRVNGAAFSTGIDFGFTHPFVAVTGFKWGNYLVVCDVVSRANLELDDKILACSHLSKLNPTVFADPEDPASAKTFATKGKFHVKEWSKNAGSVKAGIEIVRSKLQPAVGSPSLFFLKEANQIELLLSRLETYHFETDLAGNISEKPSKINDDECFTAETEVLTKKGWKSLAVVSENDEIMAVDSDCRGNWEKPLSVINKPYNGKLFKVNHNHLEWTATEGHLHSVITQANWKKNKVKKTIKKTVAELPAESYWSNNLSEWKEGPGVFPQGDKEAWMAGFWLAEGCFDTGRPTFIIVDQKKKPQQDQVRSFATELGWNWSETIGKKTECVRFVFSGQKERAQNWLKLMGQHSHSKKLEIETVMQMTHAERLSFWDGYMAGDGCRTNSAWHYDSISKDLIDGIQILTLSLGFGCRIVSYDCMAAGRSMVSPLNGKIYTSTSKIYRGNVLRKQPITHLAKEEIVEVDSKPDQRVYCVTTTKGGFLARTNGKVFVAGNCDSFRYFVMNSVKTSGASKIIASFGDNSILDSGQGPKSKDEATAIQKEMRSIIGGFLSDTSEISEDSGQESPSNSRFVWSIE
jgi:hypothetical protein